MIRVTPRSTRTYTLCHHPTLFRSRGKCPRAAASKSSSARICRSLFGSPFDAVMTASLTGAAFVRTNAARRSEEHTSELQSLMRISYAVFCLKKQYNRQHTRLRSVGHEQRYMQLLHQQISVAV